jgi:hypothetical protein
MVVGNEPVVAEVAIIDGPGKGAVFPVRAGSNGIGRTEGANSISLSFDDRGIHGSQHAIIVYEKLTKSFLLVHGGKENPVLLNGAAVKVHPLSNGDSIRVGVTTLKFTTK